MGRNLYPILLTICLSISQASPSTRLGPVIYMLVYRSVPHPKLEPVQARLQVRLEGSRFMATGKLDSLTSTMTVLGLTVVARLRRPLVPYRCRSKSSRTFLTQPRPNAQASHFRSGQNAQSISRISASAADIRRLYLYPRKSGSAQADGLICHRVRLYLIGYATGFYTHIDRNIENAATPPMDNA
jgi:PTS system mannose-specific IID component